MEDNKAPKKGGMTAIEYGIVAVLVALAIWSIQTWLDPYITWALDTGFDAVVEYLGL